MIDKLDHLVATGITALELMPLADFAGRRNWGYDGVLWYAPDSAYGRPDDLKALIDEAHLRGLMVFLDVVYNHFGPEGNYLGRYAPAFFTEAQTPWGSAIDYRVPRGARLRHRECAVLAARISLRRAAAGCGARHRRARRNLDAARSQPRGRRARRGNRPAHSSGARERRQPREPARCRARSAARQIPRAVERRLSSRLARAADRRDPGLLRRLSALAAARHRARAGSGFVYQGEASAHRGGQLRGEPSGELAPTAFVNFLQNHDQIGNRALGDRLESIAQARGDRSRAGDHLAGAVPSRCCSWARNGARKRRFRSSAISRAISPRPCARAGAGNSPGPMRNMATRFPIRWTQSTFQSAVLDWEARDDAAGQAAAGAGAGAARDPPARDRSAACGRGLRRRRRRPTTAC